MIAVLAVVIVTGLAFGAWRTKLATEGRLTRKVELTTTLSAFAIGALAMLIYEWIQ